MEFTFEQKRNVALASVLGAGVGAMLGVNTGSLPLGVVVAVLGAAVAGLGTYWSVRWKLDRHKAFEAVARANGWTAHLDLGPGPGAILQRCLPSRRGHSQRAPHALMGQREGHDFCLMDAQYTTGSGRHSRTHRIAALAVMMPFAHEMTIEREGAGHKLFDALGGEDIDVEHDLFSRTFWVRSPDRRTTYAILHPKCIEGLLAMGPGWTWHWTGHELLLTRQGRLEPHQCVELLSQGMGFLRTLPRHLLAERGPRHWLPV